MTKRGRVQRDTSVGDGVLAVEGRQYIFRLQGMWRSEMPPRMGMLVDVTFNTQGAPESIVAVPDSNAAREHEEMALAAARRLSDEVAGGLKARFGVPAMVAEAALLVGFFFVPMVTLTFIVEKSFSFWEVIGIDVSSLNNLMNGDRGFLSVIAIVCLLAPLAVPFVKKAWGRWLYAAPLGFVAVACITLYVQFERAASSVRETMGGLGGEMGRQMTDQAFSMFHVGFGFFIVLAAALYLATRSFARSR